jgi:hypothetical protein
MRWFLVVAVVAVVACTSSSHVPIATIAPRPDDVATIDGIVRAYYDIVNVAPGAPRQWDRDHTLYAPWIRFVAIGRERHVLTHQEFVDASEPMMKVGFLEKEIKRTVTRFGNVAHVTSTYETATADRQSRGVNMLQLYFDGTRWWIESAIWQDETSDLPIPAELLP